MATIGTYTYPNKPPSHWIAAKRRLGMSDAAWGRIWFRNYTDEKRFTAWLAAPPEDWEANHMRKP